MQEQSVTRPWWSNLLRGGAIGVTEALPGISGGTVALIVRVYDTLIDGAGHIFGSFRLLLTDLIRGRGIARAGARFRQAEWRTIAPVLVGMAVFLVLAILLIEPLIGSYTQVVYALFFGLVLGSLPIPYAESGRRWRLRDYGFGLIMAAIAFTLAGLPQVQLDPNPWIVALGAAIAICALVIPGISGSFILLTLGLYEPALRAVRDVDLAYIAVFGAGAIIGLGTFVQLLQYLLTHRRHITMVLLTGLMAGSLRALWPWSEDAVAGQPFPLWAVITALIVGFAAVSTLVWWERRSLATGQLHRDGPRQL